MDFTILCIITWSPILVAKKCIGSLCGGLPLDRCCSGILAVPEMIVAPEEFSHDVVGHCHNAKIRSVLYLL